MTEQTEQAAEIVRDLAFAAKTPSELNPGGIYAWLTSGQVHKIDLTGDEYLEYPRRKAGTVIVRNADSFAHYYAKHSGEHSEVFASLDAATFTAVLDAHGGESDEVRWQQHRLILQLEQTLPWKTWLANDRRMLGQQQFAEFLEDHARHVVTTPGSKVTAADLLEVAQKFQAHTKVNFQQGKRLATGETSFTYTEEIQAKAGDRGTIEVPAEFTLGIVPFDDCLPKPVRARFRYRLASGELTLGYFLDDPAAVAREAVMEIAQNLAADIGVTIMQGQPAR